MDKDLAALDKLAEELLAQREAGTPDRSDDLAFVTYTVNLDVMPQEIPTLDLPERQTFPRPTHCRRKPELSNKKRSQRRHRRNRGE